MTALSDYILVSDKKIISYEEVATVLDAHFFVAKERAWH
jgi:hypothetical protein